MTPVSGTRPDRADELAHIRVLGVRVDAVTEQSFLEIVRTWVAERTPRQVVTINPEFVMLARRDPQFAAVLEGADLATPDGVGVVWAARRQGLAIPGRLGGMDAALPLARQCAQYGHSLFLLGAHDGVADLAARRLQGLVPGLAIAGTYSGSPDPCRDDEIAAIIGAVQPDILMVAYGAPAQDLWIARNKDRLQVPVSIGVGGTLDYLAGIRRRAPALLQRLWLDWAFRLATQPWRWRRMLAIPRFIWAVFRDNGS